MLLRYHLRHAALVLAVAAIVACDEDTSGPGGEGQMSVAIMDDPTATAFHQAPTRAAMFVINAQTGAAQFTGSVSGDARVEISTDGETWISLGNPQGFTLDAQSSGNTSTVYTEADIPVDVYTRARLIMEDAVASISAGSEIGGVVLNADVELMLGGTDQSVAVEVPLSSVNVTADATTMLFFDLNAESWVTSSTVTTGMVSDADLNSAVTVAVETETE